ncbi:MAG: hypothetical protein SNJ52_00170 [Verrucomicrobiia bacterium]
MKTKRLVFLSLLGAILLLSCQRGAGVLPDGIPHQLAVLKLLVNVSDGHPVTATYPLPNGQLVYIKASTATLTESGDLSTFVKMIMEDGSHIWSFVCSVNNRFEAMIDGVPTSRWDSSTGSLLHYSFDEEKPASLYRTEDGGAEFKMVLPEGVKTTVHLDNRREFAAMMGLQRSIVTVISVTKSEGGRQ